MNSPNKEIMKKGVYSFYFLSQNGA